MTADPLLRAMQSSNTIYVDPGYAARRDRLLEALRAAGPRGATTWALRGQLGWASREVTAKLRSLRTDGHATYNPGTERWTATKEIA